MSEDHENSKSQIPADVHLEILKYKTWAGDRLQNLEVSVRDMHGRVDLVEANQVNYKVALNRVENRLERAEDQREKFNNHMLDEMKSLKDQVSSLSVRDNERHGELVGYIAELTKEVKEVARETDRNSDYISKTEAAHKQEEYADKKVEEALAPRNRLWDKVKMTGVTVVTAAVLAVLGKLAWIAITLDNVMQLGN